MGAAESKIYNGKMIKVGVWNMLADGLSKGEFMSEDPASIVWAVRGPRVINILNNMFAAGYDVIVVLENDHFLNILEGLNNGNNGNGNGNGNSGMNIHGSIQRVRNNKNINNSFTQLMDRNYPLNKDKTVRNHVKNPDNTFNNDIKDVFDCMAFVELINKDKPSTPLVHDFLRTDAFVADYGNSIYWNAHTVTTEPVFAEFNPTNKNRGYKCYIGRGDTGFVQKFYKNGVEFNVLAAHLKSGEGREEEQERVDSLLPMLQSMSALKNPVVLMDSNSSSHYREGIENNVSKVIQDTGFVNAVPQDDDPMNPDNKYQCFKMRAARAEDGKGQPAKFAELMFDTIDAILVKEGISFQIVPVEGVELYREMYKPNLLQFRTNTSVRQRISDWALNWPNEYNEDGTYKSSGFAEIRSPKTDCTPIQNKEKTVTLKMMSSDNASRWGEDVTKNAYKGMAKYIGEKTDLNMTDKKLEVVFAWLYPNDCMPSDHPPIGAMVELV